jgi:hypothetical protein
VRQSNPSASPLLVQRLGRLTPVFLMNCLEDRLPRRPKSVNADISRVLSIAGPPIAGLADELDAPLLNERDALPDHSPRRGCSTLMPIMIVGRSTRTLLESSSASRSATLAKVESPLTEKPTNVSPVTFSRKARAWDLVSSRNIPPKGQEPRHARAASGAAIPRAAPRRPSAHAARGQPSAASLVGKRRSADLAFLGSRRFAAKTPDFAYWILLDFLGFSRPNRDLSMGCAGISAGAFTRPRALSAKPPGGAGRDLRDGGN